MHEGVCAQRAHIDRQVDAGYHADASRARDDAESGTHPKKPIKMRYERALYLAAGGMYHSSHTKLGRPWRNRLLTAFFSCSSLFQVTFAA